MVKDQLCMNINEDGTWEYAVVTQIFDDRYITVDKHGRVTQIYFDNEDLIKTDTRGNEVHTGKGYTEMLYKNGNPIILKKSFFGKYKFPK